MWGSTRRRSVSRAHQRRHGSTVEASLTLAAPATVDYSACSATNFNFTYGLVNSAGVALNNVTISQTLDTRLSFSTTAASLQTTLAATYGTGVVVSITSSGSGINNVLNVSNITLPIGSNNFVVGVTKAAGAIFTNNEVVSNVAVLGGLPVALGSSSTSDNPNTTILYDNTNITINLTVCNTAPIANNDTATTLQNTSIIIPVIAGNGAGSIADTDIDGNNTINNASILFSNGTNTITVAGQGTFTANTNGTVTFVPVSTFSGTVDPVTYTIKDNSNAVSNAATIVVFVTNPWDGEAIYQVSPLVPKIANLIRRFRCLD